jgi:hypothetical protein
MGGEIPMKECLRNLKEAALAGLAFVTMPLVALGFLWTLSSYLKKKHENQEEP